MENNTNISEHIFNRSIAHVIRYSAKPQHFPESVAEHTYFTVYITRILCDLLKEAGGEVDTEKAITMATVHDMEEMYSGDIIGPFKHFSSELNEAIRKVNKEFIKKVFENLPDSLAEHYTTLWREEGEQKTIEAQVVKKADSLSLLAKCKEEGRAGNKFFEKIYTKELEKLRADQTTWWLKIKELVLPLEDTDAENDK